MKDKDFFVVVFYAILYSFFFFIFVED